MSLTRPLGAGTSDRSREREARLRQTREAVRSRSGGRCEWPGCTARGTDLAHGFRRGNRVAAPLCDHPALCAWLCRAHHDAFDGRASRTDEDDEMCWWIAQEMAARAWSAHGLKPTRWRFPIDAVRELERRLRAEGRL